MTDQTTTQRPCRRNDQHDAHEWERYGEPHLCPGYIGDRAAAQMRAALAPLEAKARALREQQRAQHRAEVLREAEGALRARGKRLAGEYNDSDILHEDGPAATVATWKLAADLLRRMADEAAPAQPAEHCTHDRTIHTTHHHTPVPGCPWCAAAQEA